MNVQIPLNIQVKVGQQVMDLFKAKAGLTTEQVIRLAKDAGKSNLPEVCTLMTTQHRRAFHKNLRQQVLRVVQGNVRTNILTPKQYDCLRHSERDVKWYGVWDACVLAEEGHVK